MFTGLIEKTGTVKNITLNKTGANLTFAVDNFSDVKIGDSIAINGVCLSITSIKDNILKADIMNETLNLTNLKFLKCGDLINLERAMKLNQRLDGHIVSGHIDTTSKVKKITNDGFSTRIEFTCNTDLIIKKGSIAINGVSLTVTNIENDFFEVSLIPLTQNETNLKNLKIGDIVNIEYDLFAKYIQKFFKKDNKSKITLEFLEQNGF